ncbi:MAG TPA: hypothetical protein VGB24_17915 [Longimicrobium sp.]|jgi:hypothetical protein|uniref:hypothetical protein n=1 Tax=Longimicrobium sp. TaxID=2029185 RepID=UPI002ED88936
MASRDILVDWVLEALRARGGASNVLGVAKYIWDHHEADLRQRGDLFYTWQYDIRWAAQKLRNRGLLKPVDESRTLPWELAER